MVRVNLVDVSLLSDQHLIAEHNEIRMIVSGYRRSLSTQTVDVVLKKVKPEFSLNKGHALFFFDKLEYLRQRHIALREEGMKRGFTFNYSLDLVGFDKRLFNDYEPTVPALTIITDRIREKLDMKLSWYRYYGVAGNTPYPIGATQWKKDGVLYITMANLYTA